VLRECGPESGVPPVELTLTLRGCQLATRKRHSFKNFLVLEAGLLVRALGFRVQIEGSLFVARPVDVGFIHWSPTWVYLTAVLLPREAKYRLDA